MVSSPESLYYKRLKVDSLSLVRTMGSYLIEKLQISLRKSALIITELNNANYIIPPRSKSLLVVKSS